MSLKIRFMDQIVGLFILVAIIGLVAGLVLLGARQQWFSKTYHLESRFRTGSGISVGTPITLRGFEIGKVESISLDPKTRIVSMKFFVYDKYYEHIVLPNSVLELASSPIGLGTSLLFHPGKVLDPPAAPLEEGSYIPSLHFKDGTDLVRQGLVDRTSSDDTIGTLLSQMGPIVEKVNNILDELQIAVQGGSEGDQSNQLGTLLHSTNALIVSIDDILTGKDEGPVGDILDNVNSTSATLESAVDTTTRELTGLLQELKGVMANLNAITEDPNGLVTRLIDPKGSIKTFLDDDNRLFIKVDEMLGSVKEIVAELESFAQFVTGSTPQITGLLEEGRKTLMQGQDVLEALKNNPLLRGGVPEAKDQPNTFNSYRDVEF